MCEYEDEASELRERNVELEESLTELQDVIRDNTIAYHRQLAALTIELEKIKRRVLELSAETT